MVDTKSVAISITKKGDRKNCIALDEFTFSRVASARGGKHAFVWYDEGTYDPYFQAPNLYWSIIKQTDLQFIILFCDRLIYCLCPCFVSTVFFLHGGLRHNGISDAITNFVFPHLHNMRK